jgi:hypothetical protein
VDSCPHHRGTNMRVNKSQAMMYLLETFFSEGSIKKKAVMEELEVTEMTFRNYINEMKCYFSNFNRNEEIFYDKKSNLYRYRKF